MYLFTLNILRKALYCLVLGCSIATFASDSVANDSPAQSSLQIVLPFHGVLVLPQASEVELDLWTLLREEMQLVGQYSNEKIDQEIRWLEKNPAYLQRVTKRAAPYLHHIYSEVSQRGLPAELALLPIVESAFDPFAYSPGRAAGLWQFIPSTGKLYGLQQDWWQDQRRDVIASTDAAISYLTKAQKRFDGDWLLALAAYNAGPGAIQRAINKNTKAGKTTDYWSLKLARETSRYVPRLLAISTVIQSPEKYGVELHPLDNEPGFTAVKIG